MFVVGIPEMDAKYVTKGTPAVVRVQALGNEEFPATVSRTAWALSSRTLQAQIDIPNPTNRFVPGMYAFGKVLVERDKTLAVPTAAIFDAGNQRYCFLVQDGKVVRAAVQTGISDGEWGELLRKQVKGPSGTVWGKITGDEKIAIGDPTELTDGELVRVEEGP